MSDLKKIPVQYDFGWEVQEGTAEYDATTGTLTMQIRPGGAVHELLAGSDRNDEIRALSFAWTTKRAHHELDLVGALVAALHADSCDHADRDCGMVESDAAVISGILKKYGVQAVLA